ncbi:hypothetical protein HMPREF0491_03090 [Lachnospiraceae oral taxon 107 str. F0167]|nr:hypothetical protein HMPREF0491_03090 [Lachnospiraceae oral taxon 107 str. F0167]
MAKFNYIGIIGIYPEWNVKIMVPIPAVAPTNWNISRMECKVFIKSPVTTLFIIGIYPEWNVKNIFFAFSLPNTLLEYIQNGM